MKKSKNIKKRIPRYDVGKLSAAPQGGTPWSSAMTPTQIPSTLPGGQSPTIRKAPRSGWETGAYNIVGNAIGFASDMVGMFSDPTLTGTNKTYTSKGPIQYVKTDYIDNETELKALKKQNTSNALKTISSGASTGAAIGSIVPGVGTAIGTAVGALGGAIGSLFGAKKRRRKLKKQIEEENEKISNRNQYNLSDAHSNMLQQEYYEENEDTQDDVLYNNGKTPFTNGKNANALVGKGETIIDGNTGDMTEVTQGSAVGVDDVPAIIKPEDAIAGNKKNPRTGNTFAEDMRPLTRMENRLKRNTERNIKSIAANTEKLVRAYTQPLANSIIADQASVISNSNKARYKNGKNFFKSTLEFAGKNIMPVTSAIGTVMPSIWNMFKGSEKPETVNYNELYSANEYAAPALNRMAKRRYNVNPEIEALVGLESRQRYNARRLGSEGGINRAMDIAGALSLARQMSDVYAKKQNIDNDYISQEAQMMASLGAQEASNRTAAMRSAYDINARNRATQQAYTQAGLTGFSNYAQQLQKDANRKIMDDARLRVLQNYYKLGTTNSNIDYILGSLMD